MEDGARDVSTKGPVRKQLRGRKVNSAHSWGYHPREQARQQEEGTLNTAGTPGFLASQ